VTEEKEPEVDPGHTRSETENPPFGIPMCSSRAREVLKRSGVPMGGVSKGGCSSSNMSWLGPDPETALKSASDRERRDSNADAISGVASKAWVWRLAGVDVLLRNVVFRAREAGGVDPVFKVGAAAECSRSRSKS
jgi:hypothetical protein